jgi:riboflavin biosynthesis pyrimidine reductase
VTSALLPAGFPDGADAGSATENDGVKLLWPTPDAHPIDDDNLARLYQPDRSEPHLRLNFITSADGAVEVAGRSAGLGSEADQRVFGLLRQYPDALMVGAGTLRVEGYGPVRLDPKRRAWREERGLTPYPRMIVVSRRLDLAPTHPALAGATLRPVIVTCATAPPDRITALAPVADLVVYGQDDVDLPAALADLNARGLTEILCEGGPHLFGALTAAGLVDELCLSLSPLLAGPGAGRITAGAPLDGPHAMQLSHILEADGMLLLRYTRA